MFTLRHGPLSVDVIDPAGDRSRLGWRYAWGGYVWQVRDEFAGPLLTGPEWPIEHPLPFNGQGLPESFRHQTRQGRKLTWRGDAGVAIGAGEIAAQNGELRVVSPCDWRVEKFDCSARFSTRHAAAGFSYQLERTIELIDRELRSTSRLTNLAPEPLDLEWFAHPFFALTDGLIRLDLPANTQIAENPGFAIAEGKFTQKRRFIGKDDGQFEVLRLPHGEPLRCRVSHPRLTHIDFSTSFVPSECVVWGNGFTFSIEPYLARTLAPGETFAWHLSYRFGSIS